MRGGFRQKENDLPKNGEWEHHNVAVGARAEGEGRTGRKTEKSEG